MMYKCLARFVRPPTEIHLGNLGRLDQSMEGLTARLRVIDESVTKRGASCGLKNVRRHAKIARTA